MFSIMSGAESRRCENMADVEGGALHGILHAQVLWLCMVTCKRGVVMQSLHDVNIDMIMLGK